MADNVAWTAGSGTTIATDDVSGAHYQKVKLFDPTADSSTGIGIAANPMVVGGAAAHDATAAGNPVLNGAEALSADRAVVNTTDVVKLIADLVGKLVVLPYAIPQNFLKGVTAYVLNTTRTEVIAAQAAGVRIYVTHVLVTNSHATVGTSVKIEDGTTTIYEGYAAPAGGGFSCTFPVPLMGTAATALNFSCVTTGSSICVSASGYKGV